MKMEINLAQPQENNNKIYNKKNIHTIITIGIQLRNTDKHSQTLR
jgi:hypothetical protein